MAWMAWIAKPIPVKEEALEAIAQAVRAGEVGDKEGVERALAGLYPDAPLSEEMTDLFLHGLPALEGRWLRFSGELANTDAEVLGAFLASVAEPGSVVVIREEDLLWAWKAGDDGTPVRLVTGFMSPEGEFFPYEA